MARHEFCLRLGEGNQNQVQVPLIAGCCPNNAGKIREFARVPRIEDCAYEVALFRMESEAKS